MLSREAKTPRRRPRTSSACPMQTPTSSPSGRNNPPPDRPCSGGRAVMKKSRSSRLSLSSNQRASTSRRGPAREPGAQVDADRGDDRVDGGHAPRGGQPGDVGQGGEPLDAEDRQVGGGVGRRQLGGDRPRPGARRRAASAPGRGYIGAARRTIGPASRTTCAAVRTRVSPSIRGDDRAAALRRAPADHDGRAERPVVGGDRRPGTRADPRRGPARVPDARGRRTGPDAGRVGSPGDGPGAADASGPIPDQRPATRQAAPPSAGPGPRLDWHRPTRVRTPRTRSAAGARS